MAETPTRQLAEEHEYVLLVVGAMEAEADYIERTGRIHAERVAQMVDFTRNFTDGDHHAKEEDLLFPLLEERSTSAGGTISVLLSEHEAARDCIRAIDKALPDAAGPDPERAAAARGVITENLRLYSFLLPLHIGKEDTVLFSLTDELLSVQEQEMLARDFDRLGTTPGAAAMVQRYHRLAHELATAPAGE
jgi:hemerythrin-like domain-containing protein